MHKRRRGRAIDRDPGIDRFAPGGLRTSGEGKSNYVRAEPSPGLEKFLGVPGVKAIVFVRASVRAARNCSLPAGAPETDLEMSGDTSDVDDRPTRGGAQEARR
ncbi:hypothetical protein KM043_006005 [Ampulex compressa]|nr:hypothetical protein KM043_006005 [Ampulex compressa]